MERMKDLEEMLRELSEKYKNSKSVEVYEEDLEGWFKIIDDLREENKKLKKECEENDYLVEDNARWMKKCKEKTMEIKKLKSDLAFERTMLDNVRAEYESLQDINKKLKAELSKYKKQYQHSMGEDNGKLTKGGYASFNEYGELMEEDTLQELRDIGEI